MGFLEEKKGLVFSTRSVGFSNSLDCCGKGDLGECFFRYKEGD